MDIETKKNKLFDFFQYLQITYPASATLTFGSEFDSCFFLKKQIIYISEKDVKELDFLALTFIIAHEYCHALQEKDIQIKNLRQNIRIKKDRLVFPILFSLLVMVVSGLLFKLFFISVGWVLLLVCLRINLEYEAKLCDLILKSEYEADKFANQVTGCGKYFFEIISKASGRDHLNNFKKLSPLTIKILGNYTCHTHPEDKERLELSLQYEPTDIVLNLEKEGKVA